MSDVKHTALTELELAEKLVRAKQAGSRETSQYYLDQMRDCIAQSGISWGVADWDDVRDFLTIAVPKALASGETP